MCLTDTSHEDVHLIHLVWDKVQCSDLTNTAINLLLAQNARDVLNSFSEALCSIRYDTNNTKRLN